LRRIKPDDIKNSVEVWEGIVRKLKEMNMMSQQSFRLENIVKSLEKMVQTVKKKSLFFYDLNISPRDYYDPTIFELHFYNPNLRPCLDLL